MVRTSAFSTMWPQYITATVSTIDGHDAQVVGDKNDGGAQLFVYGPEQVQDLGLDGYIQGGGGLIRDEQLRVAQTERWRS